MNPTPRQSLLLPSRLPTYVADTGDGGARAAYPAAYEAFLDALWADDADAAVAIVSDSALGVNDVFAYGPAVPYQMIVPGVVYLDLQGQRLAGGGRLPVDLPRPPPPTPLGQAVAMGAVNVADALIEMGALPWPSSEALLNTALATLPATAVAPAVAMHRPVRSFDAADMTLLLLDAFAPSTSPDPWDPNPLTVLRLAATTQSDRDARRAHHQIAQLLGPLVRRYHPDAPAAAAQVPGVATTIRGATDGVPRTPGGYDSWRLDRASMTEADALAADVDAINSQGRGFAASSTPRALPDILAVFMRAYKALDDDDGDDDDMGNDGVNAHGRARHKDGDMNADAARPKRRTLPWLSVASMAPAQIAALATSRHAGRPVGVDTARQAASRLRLLYATNGCADYMGCASLLIEAIARDNAQEVQRLIAMTRGLGPNSVLDGHRLRTAGNPVVLARWQGDAATPALDATPVADAGAGLAGDVFTTPLAVAAATGATDVIAALIDAGARPWPTVETILTPALTHPLATVIDVAAVEGGTSLALARNVFAGNGDTAHVTQRSYDPAAVVGLVTRAFPRTEPPGPWDINPLTMVRAHAIHAAAPLTRRLRDRNARKRAVDRLLQVLSALLDAGYSPHDPTAGPMVRAPYSPSRTIAPTEVDAAVWTAAHTPEGTLPNALATAAVGLYAAREAWADGRERAATVNRRADAGSGGGQASATDSWVLVGDETSWQSASDDDDADDYNDQHADNREDQSGALYDPFGGDHESDAVAASATGNGSRYGGVWQGDSTGISGSLTRSRAMAGDV
nr:hypothetical protein [Pandoravirus massiliensis]